jgi:quercetin dioxygenase-like cupin family protein
MAKIVRRRIIGDQMMISHVVLEKGFSVPAHSHENEQFCMMISGKLRFEIGPQREVVLLTDGEVLHLPANVSHAAEAIEQCLVIDMFSPPSATTGVDVSPLQDRSRTGTWR